MSKIKKLGSGLGFRAQYEQDIFANQEEIDWIEIITDNFVGKKGAALDLIGKLKSTFPLAMHGVSLSLGSSEPIDIDHLKELKKLIDYVKPAWVSDHLSWSGIDGIYLNDLLPIPYNQESLDNVIFNIRHVQDVLERRIVVENPSSYVTYKESNIEEADFLKETAIGADCLILLDVNNVYVSSFNHDWDPLRYIKKIPSDRVVQMHIAGHTVSKDLIIDTHSHSVSEEVWSLFEAACDRFPHASPSLERDTNFPPFEEIMGEFRRMNQINNHYQKSNKYEDAY